MHSICRVEVYPCTSSLHCKLGCKTASSSCITKAPKHCTEPEHQENGSLACCPLDKRQTEGDLGFHAAITPDTMMWTTAPVSC